MATLEPVYSDRADCRVRFEAVLQDRVYNRVIIGPRLADTWPGDRRLTRRIYDRVGARAIMERVLADRCEVNSPPAYVTAALAAGDIVWVGPWVVLHGPGGTIDYESLTVNTQTGAGWTFNAGLPAELDIDSIAFQKLQVFIDDGLGGKTQSPPLIAIAANTVDERSDVGQSAGINGVDETTFKAGRNNHSFDTFRNTTSDAIVATLAAAAGIKVKGAPRFKVPDEDAKSTKLNDAIQRFAAAAGKEYYIDEQGVMQLVDWANVGPRVNWTWSKLERKLAAERRFTKINLGKRSAVQGNSLQGEFKFPFTDIGFHTWALPNPLIGPLIIIDRSTFGYIDWIGVWSGDPTARGKLIDFRIIGAAPGIILTPLNGAYPATHLSAWVFPPAGLSGMLPGLSDSDVACLLQVVGTPPSTVPVGVDPEFFYPYDTGLSPSWPAEDWIDSVWPSRAWAVAKAPAILAMKSKGWDSIALDGHLSASVHLRQSFVYKAHDYKVDSVGWNMPLGEESAPTTTAGLVRL